MTLEEVFEALAARREAPLGDAAAPLRRALEAHGVRLNKGRATLDAGIELLDAELLRRSLRTPAQAWLRSLRVVPCIGSTNTELMRRAARGEVDGTVLLAEVQTAGRGRRGRSWASPFGRNLAMSLGIRVRRPLAEIGAVSLATGLAVAETLAAAGVRDVAVKWPNDVLSEDRKLCGILIELPSATAPPEVVIGIGVNVGGSAALAQVVDQKVADVAEHVPEASRNALAANLIQAVFDACQRFEARGFAPMQPAYDALHRFHGKHVRLIAAAETFAGVVVGVDADGGLRLRGPDGERVFSGGEVSLRT